MRNEPEIADEFDRQPQEQDRQGNRHDELGWPGGQFDVDRAVAVFERAKEVVVRIRNEHRDQEQRHGDAGRLGKPLATARELRDEHVHPDVPTLALDERDPENREADHRDLDDVDVADHRFAEHD